MKINKALLGGSLVLLITFNIYNLFNFIFQASMARMLSIGDYAILATLYSIIYFLGIFSESIQTVITKYSSNLNNGKLKNLLKRSAGRGFKLSLFVFLAYILLAIPGALLLKIPYSLMALNGVIIFSSFLLPVPRGILQGTKRFSALGINLIIESLIKLSFAILLVFIGWKVYGPITATILGVILAFLFAIFSLKNVRKAKEEKTKTLEIWNYAKPIFVIIFAITIFYSLDVVIAKIVFPVEIAGAYAIASILAKVIFWGTQPISKAMFPLTADKNIKDKKSHTFLNALTFLGILVVIALLILWLFPGVIIKIFSGKTLGEASSVLLLIGIAMGLLSFANLNLLHKLSQGKTNGYWYFLLFVLIEIILLFVFSGSLLQFSIALITSAAIFLWGSIILLNK